MRIWIRAHGARCTCTAETPPEKAGKPTPGRKRRLARPDANCTGRRIGGDMEHAPEPHNVSLVTRFCKDAGFHKRRDMFDDFAEALRREKFDLPLNPTERNLVLSDGRRVEAMSGFVHGWMDLDDEGTPIDAACYHVPARHVGRGASGRAGRESRHSPRAARTATRGARAHVRQRLAGRRRGPRQRGRLYRLGGGCGGAAPGGSEPCGGAGRGLRTCRRRRPACCTGSRRCTESQVSQAQSTETGAAPDKARARVRRPGPSGVQVDPQGRSNRLVERNGPPESLPMEATADRYKRKKKKKTETPTDAPSVERHYQGNEPGLALARLPQHGRGSRRAPPREGDARLRVARKRKKTLD